MDANKFAAALGKEAKMPITAGRLKSTRPGMPVMSTSAAKAPVSAVLPTGAGGFGAAKPAMPNIRQVTAPESGSTPVRATTSANDSVASAGPVKQSAVPGIATAAGAGMPKPQPSALRGNLGDIFQGPTGRGLLPPSPATAKPGVPKVPMAAPAAYKMGDAPAVPPLTNTPTQVPRAMRSNRPVLDALSVRGGPAVNVDTLGKSPTTTMDPLHNQYQDNQIATQRRMMNRLYPGGPAPAIPLPGAGSFAPGALPALGKQSAAPISTLPPAPAPKMTPPAGPTPPANPFAPQGGPVQPSIPSPQPPQPAAPQAPAGGISPPPPAPELMQPVHPTNQHSLQGLFDRDQQAAQAAAAPRQAYNAAIGTPTPESRARLQAARAPKPYMPQGVAGPNPFLPPPPPSPAGLAKQGFDLNAARAVPVPEVTPADMHGAHQQFWDNSSGFKQMFLERPNPANIDPESVKEMQQLLFDKGHMPASQFTGSTQHLLNMPKFQQYRDQYNQALSLPPGQTLPAPATPQPPPAQQPPAQQPLPTTLPRTPVTGTRPQLSPGMHAAVGVAGAAAPLAVGAGIGALGGGSRGAMRGLGAGAGYLAGAHLGHSMGGHGLLGGALGGVAGYLGGRALTPDEEEPTKKAAAPMPISPGVHTPTAPQPVPMPFKPSATAGNVPMPNIEAPVVPPTPSSSVAAGPVNTNAPGMLDSVPGNEGWMSRIGAMGSQLGGAAVPGMVGAGIGGLYGALFPGEDEEGEQNSRLGSGLTGAAMGGAVGAGLGATGIPQRAMGDLMPKMAEDKAALLSWGGGQYHLGPNAKKWGVGVEAGYSNLAGLIPIPHVGVRVGTPYGGLGVSGPLPSIGIDNGNVANNRWQRNLPRGLPEYLYDRANDQDVYDVPGRGSMILPDNVGQEIEALTAKLQAGKKPAVKKPAAKETAPEKTAMIGTALLGGGVGAAIAPKGHRLEGAGRGMVNAAGMDIGAATGMLAGGGLMGIGGAGLGGLLATLANRYAGTNIDPGVAAGALGTGGAIAGGVLGGGAGGYGGYRLAQKMLGPSSYDPARKKSTKPDAEAEKKPAEKTAAGPLDYIRQQHSRVRTDLQSKVQQLPPGQTTGTFTQGKLQPAAAPVLPTTAPAAPKLQSQSWTSPRAGEFLGKPAVSAPAPKIKSESFTSPDAGSFLGKASEFARKLGTSLNPMFEGDEKRPEMRLQRSQIKPWREDGNAALDGIAERFKTTKKK